MFDSSPMYSASDALLQMRKINIEILFTLQALTLLPPSVHISRVEDYLNKVLERLTEHLHRAQVLDSLLLSESYQVCIYSSGVLFYFKLPFRFSSSHQVQIIFWFRFTNKGYFVKVESAPSLRKLSAKFARKESEWGELSCQLFFSDIFVVLIKESNRLILPVQVRFGFNSCFKFRFSSG